MVPTVHMLWGGGGSPFLLCCNPYWVLANSANCHFQDGAAIKIHLQCLPSTLENINKKVSIAQMNIFCLAGFYSGKKVTDMGFPPFYFSFDYAVMRTNVMWASQRLRGKRTK